MLDRGPLITSPALAKRDQFEVRNSIHNSNTHPSSIVVFEIHEAKVFSTLAPESKIRAPPHSQFNYPRPPGPFLPPAVHAFQFT